VTQGRKRGVIERWRRRRHLRDRRLAERVFGQRPEPVPQREEARKAA